ncbi:hypothetical protein BT63DRAFT_476732 [Microthyrium microscopicum]|uniref:DNA endonuclease activator Ctp1 C-terminal domain-containing protein n=1 Tax=Microthyrium microscopicum TaxID=703497 RepID=A0A6A6ULV8_9PEZI|nr:hypothetical protein BT63DRAFT_476732 [Microthyrium microscopicum]
MAGLHQESENDAALAQAVVDGINQQITKAVTEALGKQRQQFTDEKDRIQSLEAKVLELNTCLAGVRSQHNAVSKCLTSLLDNSTRNVGSASENRAAEHQKTVSHSEYLAVCEKASILQAELSDSIERNKLEASARVYLMAKLRAAKTTAREWIDYHERWVAKHSKDKHSKPGKLLNADGPTTTPRGTPRSSLIETPRAPSPGIESFEAIFQQNHDLPESGPVDFAMDDLPEDDMLQDQSARSKNTQVLVSRTQELLGDAREGSPILNVADPSVPESRVSPANFPPRTNDPSSETAIGSESRVGDTSVEIHRNKPSKDDQLASSSVLKVAIPNATENLIDSAGKAAQTMPPPVSSGSSSDLVFVSERPTKRRKGVRESDPGVRVKQEPSSFVDNAHVLGRKDTLDLDEVNRSTMTPRKRKAAQQVFMATDQPRQQGRPLRHERSISEGHEPQNLEPTPRALRPLQSRATRKEPAVRSAEPKAPLPATIKAAPNKYGYQAKPKRLTNGQNTRLFAAPEYQGNHAQRGHKVQTKVGIEKPSTWLDTPRRGKENIDPALETRQTRNNESRLRDKPLAMLQLGDFRLNRHVDHSKLATPYQRSCLPGCTDARCCGPAMREQAGLIKPTLQRPPFPNSPEDADLSDDEYLMKWFLGQQWDRREVQMLDQEERDKILLDARTKLTAERYGKHRTEDTRRMTPPGFWDMSFPSTQKIQDLNKEAQLMDENIVRERYEDALRGGGRWMFRDE